MIERLKLHQLVPPSVDEPGRSNQDGLKQISSLAPEATQAITRADYSAESVARLVGGFESHPVLVPITGSTISYRWIEETGIPGLLQLTGNQTQELSSEAVRARRWTSRRRASSS